MEKQINWQLNINEAQYILSIMSERPYKESSDLIHKLMQQSNQPDVPPENDGDETEH